MTMRILSVRRRSPRMEQKTRFQLRTKRSHDPLWRGVAGGLNLLLIFLWTRSSGASSLFFLMFSTSSVFLPTNYVPLSDQITENVPRRAANVSIPKTHELVSREETTFGCTARVVKHVNKKLFASRSIAVLSQKAGPNIPHLSLWKVVFRTKVAPSEGLPSYAITSRPFYDDTPDRNFQFLLDIPQFKNGIALLDLSPHEVHTWVVRHFM